MRTIYDIVEKMEYRQKRTKLSMYVCMYVCVCVCVHWNCETVHRIVNGNIGEMLENMGVRKVGAYSLYRLRTSERTGKCMCVRTLNIVHCIVQYSIVRVCAFGEFGATRQTLITDFAYGYHYGSN